MNSKQILGIVTITVIIGGTIYAIKKAKDLEKLEENIISLDEAREMVRLRKLKEEPIVTEEELLEIEEIETSGEVDLDSDPNEEDGQPTDSLDFYDDVDYNIPLSELPNYEEEKVLRFDPNSNQANNQFIKMELAEWVPMSEPYQTMLKLFNFPFKPKNDGDHILWTQIVDYRAQFFGMASRWTQEVTFADVILHYARVTDFNCGSGVSYWVEHILEFNEFTDHTSSMEIDILIDKHNDHTYFNEELQTFGLFGLSRYQIEEANRVSLQNIDKQLTYEIEYNVFLKDCL